MGKKSISGTRSRPRFYHLESNMAPSRPSRDVKLTVPRFNSKKITPKVAKEVVAVAKRDKFKVDVKQTVDPTTALALAIVRLFLVIHLWYTNKIFRIVRPTGILCL